MARTPLSDPLVVHEFHLWDIDFSMSIPPWVLLPSVGFSSISAPEITVNVNEITEGTSDYIYPAMGKATTNSIVLTKGATAFNSDFWRWMIACLKGSPTKGGMLDFVASLPPGGRPTGVPGKRRNLILMHFSGLSIEGIMEAIKVGDVTDKIRGSLLMPAGLATEGVSRGLSTITGGMIDLGIASVPAKVFILYGCLPVRYKPGSDFDAATSAVSIEELELRFTYFQELALYA